MPRCFLFKPDGIGDFFLSTGAIRFLARKFGEENLTITALPVMWSVARGQFPKARFVPLPIRKKRVLLNVFVANCIRCFPVWISILRDRHDLVISLRHMRDYLMNVVFYSVPGPRHLACDNQLLGNGRLVRRWTEKAFITIFHPELIAYPDYQNGIPKELEVNRRLVSRALGREVPIHEVWPELRRVGEASINGEYWVCAPFANGGGKDYPAEKWSKVFSLIEKKEGIPRLILTGSADQGARLSEFAAQIARMTPELDSRISVIHPSDLQQFIDLLAQATLVLTVDTAAAHASTALDRPTLVLFSGQHRGTYGPWTRSAAQRWIQPEEKLLGTREWHRDISPEAVCPVAQDILNRGLSHPHGNS